MNDDPKRNWLGPYIPQGNLFRDVIQQVKLAYNLMLDPRVNPITKLIPIAALGYLVLPPDILPDIIPVVGQVDDVFVLIFGLRMFFEFAPAEVVSEHLNKLVARVKGDWSVVNEPETPTDKPNPPAGGEVVDDGPQP